MTSICWSTLNQTTTENKSAEVKENRRIYKHIENSFGFIRSHFESVLYMVALIQYSICLSWVHSISITIQMLNTSLRLFIQFRFDFHVIVSDLIYSMKLLHCFQSFLFSPFFCNLFHHFILVLWNSRQCSLFVWRYNLFASYILTMCWFSSNIHCDGIYSIFIILIRLFHIYFDSSTPNDIEAEVLKPIHIRK